MPAYPMAVNPVFYPPVFSIPPLKKVLPQTPAPVATDNPPFPGTRAGWINTVRESWNLPYIPAQSKASLKSFYNPQWDIPDNPPLLAPNTPSSISRIQNVLNTYAYLNAISDFYTYQLLSGSPRGKRRSINIDLLPPIDNPPPLVSRKRDFKILDTYYTLTSQLLYGSSFNTLSGRRGKLINPALLEVPIVIQDTGLIAFQPNAFQIGYPRRRIAFQGMNRFVGIRNVQVKPFIRIVTLVHRNHLMEEHKPGDAVVISVYIFDPTQIPETLFTPDSVKLTLYNPDETVRVNDQALTEVSTGFLSYIHQTSTGDPLGVYTARFVAQNFGTTGITLRQEVFKLIED